MKTPSTLSYFKQLPKEITHQDKEFSLEEKKDLFKKMVDHIELESHAFCNRKCSFCANSFLDRVNTKDMLDWSLFKIILEDLSEINYNKIICFARYSEPLANRDILDYLKTARNKLPNAKLLIITNGDYLTREYLNELIVAGLDKLQVSIYPNVKTWNKTSALSDIRAFSSLLNLELKPISIQNSALLFTSNNSSIKIDIRSSDLMKLGYNRANSIKQLTDLEFNRQSPCYMPFRSLQIDHNGNVPLCCNIRSDDPEHKEFILGKVQKKKDIFNIFYNSEFQKWRGHLIHWGHKPAPCSSCSKNDKENETIYTRINQYIINKFQCI